MTKVSPLKLLLFSKLFPPAWGGTPRILGGLFSQFEPDEVTVLTEKTRGEFAEEWPANVMGMRRIAAGMPYHIVRADQLLGNGILERLFIRRRAALGNRLVRQDGFTAILGQIPGPQFAASAFLTHQATGVPLFLYYVDTTMPYPGERRWRRNLIDDYEARWIKAASHVFVCSEGLDAELRSRLPLKESTILRHSLPVELLDAPVHIRRKSGDPARIVFVGTVRKYSHLRPLLFLMEAMEELSKERRIRLDIFSNATREMLISNGAPDSDLWSVSMCGPRQAIEEQRNADLILVSVDDQSPLQPLLRTIFPTRTVEAMMTGVPILVVGPEDSYTVQYAKAHDFAYTVTDIRKEAILKAVNVLLADEERRERAVRNAIRTAKSQHDPRMIAQLFRQTIIETAGSPGISR